MFTDIGKQFERMSDMSKRSKQQGKATDPLSPVARIKFFHLGCSHINKEASAVSVHQHIVRLKIFRSLKRGRKVEMDFRTLTSEASGYVSVGCFA